MKNFVINLPQSKNRRESVEKELNKIGITANFIDAVYGKLLTEDELSRLIVKTNYLSLGEIGCALSHLKIYKMMIDERLPYAMIFEDDLLINELFDKSVLERLKSIIKQIPKEDPCVINLYDSGFKSKPSFTINNKLTVNKTVNSFTTHAYIINLQAAKNILKIQTPIKFEIDAWKHYVYLHKLNLYNTVPSLSIQNSSFNSIIDELKDRDFSNNNRAKMKKFNLNICFKELPLHKKIKTYLFRIYKNF